MYKKSCWAWMRIDGENLLTNDLGRYVFLDDGEFRAFRENRLDKGLRAFECLKEHGFLYDCPDHEYAERWAPDYAAQKNCLLASTQLFILVLTTRCNQKCVYCQAGDGRRHANMSIDTCKRAVDLAVQSPTNYVTIEFQGGEPTLNPEALHFVIPYAKQTFRQAGKQVQFAIVTNLTQADPGLIGWLASEGVSISTSLDGPRALHDANRPLKNGLSSYEQWRKGLALCREALARHGGADAGAIETTTRASLSDPVGIVQEYRRQGYHTLYIRPLTPLGCAAEEWARVGYTAEEYLRFYLAVLDELFRICKEGYFLCETTASLYLVRILLRESVGHTEFRSPCGAAVGQMAINCDGQVYTCDEGRMLANMGDDTFRLGTVDDTYSQLVTSPAAHATCTASCVETLPLCDGCAFQPYCSACPVVTYSCEGDLVSHDPHGYRCTIAKGILTYLFRKIRTADEEEMRILNRWAQN